MNKWIYNHHDLKPIQLLMIETTEPLSAIVKNTTYWVEFSQFYYILSEICVEGLYNLCSVHHCLFLDLQDHLQGRDPDSFETSYVWLSFLDLLLEFLPVLLLKCKPSAKTLLSTCSGRGVLTDPRHAVWVGGQITGLIGLPWRGLLSQRS